MLLALVGLLFAVPVLWAVSVGAVREVRRARARDPRVGCQAWVAVAGLGGCRYRCCEPVFAGGSLCRRHEVERSRAVPGEEAADPDLEMIDQPQAVGRALVQARIGIPLAAGALLGLIVLGVWASVRIL